MDSFSELIASDDGAVADAAAQWAAQQTALLAADPATSGRRAGEPPATVHTAPDD